MSAQSHFFIESGGFTQSEQQAFGPVSNTEFNLTSRFSVNSPQKAYSICKGVVLIQPQEDLENGKVNLILRPYKQPFPGLNIKYFVYRGLRKSDFFTKDGEYKVIAQTTQTSDFIKTINSNFEAFYQGSTGLTQPDFKAAYIGYDEENAGNRLLSSFFFKESKFETTGNTLTEKDPFELPIIDSGKTLGYFSGNDCGIDVVLNYGDYEIDDKSEFTFNLEYARKHYATILANGSTDFAKKLQREQSTQFIDIVAFYGLFANNGKIKTTTSTGETMFKTSTSIYNDLLINFYTRNKVYLYIESNRHRSYNFYNNYKLSESSNVDIKTGTSENLTETTYNNLSWPVVIFDNDQLTSNDYNDLSIQLVTSSDYEEIALYSIVGSIDTESERQFIVKENLLDLDSNTVDSNFTKTISFKVPNINIGGQNKNISSLIRLVYIGKQLDFSLANNYTVWADKKRHSLYNNIFPNLTIKPVFNNNQNFLTASFNRESLINYKGFSNYMNESILNGSVVFHEGKKEISNSNSDKEILTNNRVLFIAKKVETLDDFSIHNTEVFAQGGYAKKINIDSNLVHYSNYFSSLYGSKNYNLKHYIINESENDIKILSLNFKDNFDFDFYNLGLTKDELNILKEIIPVNSSNVNFYLLDPLVNPHISTITNISYFKYSLGIIYENGEGILSILMPSEPIYVYGISHNFLTTKEYTEYEEKSINGNIIIENNI